jgi:hypothetical protein
MSSLLSDIETQVRRRLLESATLATPGSITITHGGTPAGVTWSYQLVAVDATGTTQAGATSTTATGAATLNGTNYNILAWVAITGATGYWIYRTAVGTSPTTTGRIAVLGAVTTYNDQGAAGDGTTAPTTNTSGLTEPFWSSDELIAIENNGIKDLWRDIADLKQEHYLTVDTTNVTLDANATSLTGVPADVHKIVMIEPLDLSVNGSNHGLLFKPLPYYNNTFQLARSKDPIDPVNDTIYYDIHGQGSPVSAPTIRIAPKVTSQVKLSFVYVPTLTLKAAGDQVPIPAEADNALIAWTVAFARAKESEDRSPDAAWLSIYAAEKAHLLQSLGLRQYQEPSFCDAMFQEYW